MVRRDFFIVLKKIPIHMTAFWNEFRSFVHQIEVRSNDMVFLCQTKVAYFRSINVRVCMIDNFPWHNWCDLLVFEFPDMIWEPCRISVFFMSKVGIMTAPSFLKGVCSEANVMGSIISIVGLDMTFINNLAV